MNRPEPEGDVELKVPVLVVGGGPAGLTAVLELARRGIGGLLVERRGFTAHFPRAHLLNVRTMETLHDVGVAEEVYREWPPEDRWHKCAWYTSLAGPTPWHGRKIGEVDAWGGGADAARYAAASPRRFAQPAAAAARHDPRGACVPGVARNGRGHTPSSPTSRSTPRVRRPPSPTVPTAALPGACPVRDRRRRRQDLRGTARCRGVRVAAGYFVAVHVLMIAEDVAVTRVAKHVEQGGHSVPENKIRERYQRLWDHVADAAGKVQSAAFWDNSTLDGPELVADFANGQLLAAPKWPSWTPGVLTGRWPA